MFKTISASPAFKHTSSCLVSVTVKADGSDGILTMQIGVTGFFELSSQRVKESVLPLFEGILKE